MKKAVPLNRYAVFFLVVVAGCAIDLATKSLVFSHLGLPGSPNSTWWIWNGVFGFQTSLNEGALFGIGQGFWPLFAALSIGAAIAIIIWLFGAGAAEDRLLNVALALVTAGILGNLYDRLGMPGLQWPYDYRGHLAGETMHVVRDFILVMIGSWPWPTFNIADSLLCCGAGLLVCHAFFVKVEEEPEASDTPQLS